MLIAFIIRDKKSIPCSHFKITVKPYFLFKQENLRKYITTKLFFENLVLIDVIVLGSFTAHKRAF